VIKASRSMVRIDTTSVHSDGLAGLSERLSPHWQTSSKKVP
jgi:hypothetical protein